MTKTVSVKLTSALPEGEANGLGQVHTHLCDQPTDMHVAVVVLDCHKLTTDVDTGEVTPTARVRRIEVITRGDDKTALRCIATRAFEARTGKTVLPLDLEDELRAAFGENRDGDED